MSAPCLHHTCLQLACTGIYLGAVLSAVGVGEGHKVPVTSLLLKTVKTMAQPEFCFDRFLLPLCQALDQVLHSQVPGSKPSQRNHQLCILS